MAVSGDFSWPPPGKSDGRPWGESHGRRHGGGAAFVTWGSLHTVFAYRDSSVLTYLLLGVPWMDVLSSLLPIDDRSLAVERGRSSAARRDELARGGPASWLHRLARAEVGSALAAAGL
jgi:hypothetical protein